MYKLIFEREDIHAPYSSVNSVIMEIDDERNLDQMLEAFGQFLKATGYNFNGEITTEEQE